MSCSAEVSDCDGFVARVKLGADFPVILSDAALRKTIREVKKGLAAANFDTDLGFSNLPFEPALR